MKTALVIPMFNRPEYVAQCFASIEKANIPDDVLIVLVDDGSTEQMPFLSLPHKYIKKPENTGVKDTINIGIQYAINNECFIFIVLDSDAIVKPNFIQILSDLHVRSGRMVSGFNNPKEPTIGFFDEYCEKQHANGINLCFSLSQHWEYVWPALIKNTGNWDYDCSHGRRVFITTPSIVQHIGLKSSMGHIGADVAVDFYTDKLQLPNVTLFGIDSHDKAGLSRAATISTTGIDFGAVNMLHDDLFTKGGSNEKRRQDYSAFMINELHKQFNTSHVLTIHADGYVINPAVWSDEWLKYDYIGAPWWYNDGYNVGNGGFSLRSKKLCELLAAANLEHTHPEDHCICRVYRKSLEEAGIKFAPEEVARQFAIEAYGVPAPGNKYSGQFGFHGLNVDFKLTPYESIGYVKGR